MRPQQDTSKDTLFTRLAAGHPAALDELCRRYGPHVSEIARARLFRRLRARVETADVAQDAMVEIVSGARAQRFSDEASFLRWAREVVQNRVLQLAKRWGAARRRIDREEPFPEGRSSPDLSAERPSQLFERKQRADRLTEAIARLPEGDREVLVARLLLEMPWSAVAASLGTSEEAAQMRFTRARRKLRALLTPDLAPSGKRGPI